jgi:uncharacterized protein (DUF849 family)
VLIKAAINGGRTRAQHPAAPVSPEEQAADVVECLKAGADAVHLHVRVTSLSTSDARSRDAASDSNKSSRPEEQAAPMGTSLVRAAGESVPESEKESLDGGDVARTLLTVRAAAPDAAIGVSTGAWILPDTAARFEAVAAWEVLPDFASVNFSEDGAVELAKLLLSRGVGVEAGLSDAADAEKLLASGLAASCIRVLLEPQEQEMAHALETVNAIEKVFAARRKETRFPPLLLHGTEATTWPMLDEAIARGYDVRIGLEDTRVMPDGRIAKDNSELVREAVRRVKSGR